MKRTAWIIRIAKTPEGTWRALKPVWSKRFSKPLLTQRALYKGAEVETPGGHWEIEWYENGKRQRRRAGPHPADAVKALAKQKLRLQAMDAGIALAEAEPADGKRPLKQAVEEFLAEKTVVTMGKRKDIPAVPHLKPVDPRDDTVRAVAVHEAAHAILFAYSGVDRIALDLRACYLRSSTKLDLSFLPAALAGYAADVEINRLSEAEALRRTESDRRISAIMLQEPDPRLRKQHLEESKTTAILLVRRFATKILALAKRLQSDGAVAAAELEKMSSIREIRELGIHDRAELAKKVDQKTSPSS